MNGQQLRSSILQEAIAGRLVSQDPKDEPAGELLKRIRAEKARLIKEGKLPKDKNETIIFRGDDKKFYEQKGKTVTCIDDQIPFEIPDSWEWAKLSQIVRIRLGKTPPRSKAVFWNDGIFNWVSISDMADYGHVKTSKEKVSGASKALMGDLSPAGTLIMSFKLTVGRTSILEIPAYHNEAIISIFPYVDKNYALRNYLFYVLPLISNYGEAKNAIKGATLNKKSLEDLSIPLPPLAEQKHIVAKIEELMPLVDEYEKAQEEFDNLNAGLKSKLRASLLQEAISGRLVPQDPSDEPASKLLKRINPKAIPLETEQPLPQGWCATTLSDTCTTINGLWKGKKGPFVNVGVIRNANFTKDFKLDYSKIQYLDVEQKSFAKRNLLDGDLIVEKSGGGDKTPVGRAILYEGENGIYSFSNFTMLLRIRDKAEILPKYIYYFLLAKYRSGAMFGMQTQTTGLRNLETDKYLSMPVYLPPLAEQKRIVEKLESLFAVLDSLDKIVA